MTANAISSTVFPILLQEPDWWGFINQLLPILLVVGIGLLTVMKRLFERFVLKREARALEARSRDEQEAAGGEAPAAKPPTVMAEIQKYVEMLEGKRKPDPSEPPAPPAALTPPPAAPTVAPPPRAPQRIVQPVRYRDPSIETGNLETTRLKPLAPGVGPLIERSGRSVIGTRDDYAVPRSDLSLDMASIKSSISVSYAELRRGSGPAQLRERGLSPVTLARGRDALRTAMIWSEILRSPLALREESR